MRRVLLALVSVLLSLFAAGCGSSSSSTSGPLATELSYFPTGSLFVATVATNPRGSPVQGLDGLLGAFPLAKLGITVLDSELESAGVDYQSEVEPLYGNPVVLGALQAPGSSSMSSSSFLAVWITKSAPKLASLVKGLHALSAAGTADGAPLYRAGSTTLAIDGATAVLGSSPAVVDAAIRRHAHGGGISIADYAKAMGGLPRNTLAQAFGSLAGALSSSSSIRSEPWIAAIRGYAASVSVTSSGIIAQFRLDTAGGSLTTSELPIAPGSGAPPLAGTLPIAVGLRDPAQTADFIETLGHSVDPKAYARFTRRQLASKRRTGYDLNRFVALLSGDLVLESNEQTTMGRAEVRDRSGAARQLARFPELARYLFPTAKSVTRQPGDFYAVEQAHGKPFELGLVRSEFVAGLATPAQLRSFATAPTTPVPNAQGSVAFRVGLVDLVRIALKKSLSPFLAPALAALGDITGSASATPEAVAGQVTLKVK